MTARNERVRFRYLVCPECQHQMCWVNPRLPNYCPECGKHIQPAIKSSVYHEDAFATLRYSTGVFEVSHVLRTDPEAAP